MYLCGVEVGGGMCVWCCLFCQAEDGIRDLVRSRGLGDVYKRQHEHGLRHRRRVGPRGAVELAAVARVVLRDAARHALSLIHI